MYWNSCKNQAQSYLSLESATVGFNVIIRSDPCEDPVTNPELGSLGWNMAADLSQYLQESNLSDID